MQRSPLRPVGSAVVAFIALTLSSTALAVQVPFSLDLTKSPLVVPVPQFDGQLDSVEYRLTGDAVITATIKVSGGVIDDSAVIPVVIEYRVSGPNVAFAIPENLDVFPTCTVDSGTECEGTYPLSTFVDTDPGAPIVLTGPDVDAYEGTGTVDVELSIAVLIALPGDPGYLCPDTATCEVVDVQASWAGTLELVYPVAVPVPASASLLVAGLAGLAVRRRPRP